MNAIIFGHLVKTFGKVQTAKFNKIALELGYDRVTAKDIKKMADRFEKDDTLDTLVQQSIVGEIGLEDLTKYKSDRKPFLEKSTYDVVTAYQVEHQRVLANNREFNKIQREGAYVHLLFDGLKNTFREEFATLSKPKYDFTYTRETLEGDKELVVLLSDLHIGALVNNLDTGGYNFEILNQRLTTYLHEIKQMAELMKVSKVRIYNLGDNIEHINMRSVNQAFEAEFTAVEQIAKATRLIVDFVMEVEKVAPVKYGMIGGNHDRFQGNKNDKIYNDNVAYLILDYMFMMQEFGMLQQTELIDNREDIYGFEDTVQGKVIKASHGDSLKGKGAHIHKFVKDHGIDYLVTGHVHHHLISQEDFARLHITNASPMGANNFSKELNLPLSTPSQTMFVLGAALKGPIIYTVFFEKD